VSGIVAFSFVQARRYALWRGRRAELIEGWQWRGMSRGRLTSQWCGASGS
jgi:hypothetical protein